MKTHVLFFTLFTLFSVKAQTEKDTLFFTYDKKYITSHIEIPNHFYIKDGSGYMDGTFHFVKGQIVKNQNIRTKEICLEKFIRSSKFYDKNKKPKLNDYALWEYFKEYVIILVKYIDGKKQYIQVESSFEIE